MIIGGLDVNERRYDDITHDRPAEEAWHDVDLLVRGPVVADGERHFRTMWNAEGPPPPRADRGPSRPCSRGARGLALPDPLPDDPIAAPSVAGAARAQLLRTVSRRRSGLLAFTPRGMRRDLEAGHHAVIDAAEELLYIETQFFRLRSLSRHILARAKARPSLKVVILLAQRAGGRGL